MLSRAAVALLILCASAVGLSCRRPVRLIGLECGTLGPAALEIVSRAGGPHDEALSRRGYGRLVLRVFNRNRPGEMLTAGFVDVFEHQPTSRGGEAPTMLFGASIEPSGVTPTGPLPTGTLKLRVRALTFRPSTAFVEVIEGRTDTLSVLLDRDVIC